MNIPLNIDWQQILLHVLNFVILAGGLYLLLYKPVRDFMEKRAAFYAQQDAQSAQRLAAAEKAESEARERLERADADAAARLDAACREADEASRRQLDEVRAQAGKILADARAAADHERARAISDARAELKELALDAAEKLACGADNDALDSFLDAAERGERHE